MRLNRKLASLGTAAALTLTALAGAATPSRADGEIYTNPVSESFADTYADPAVILAKDGWWYAYATADPLRAGDAPGIGHIARTRDWITWDYVGTIFNQANRPTWAEPSAGLWAPDIRYIDGQYVLYFTVTDTTLNPGGDSAIGVATAPSPAGPFTPVDEPIVAPQPKGPGDYKWTFDPSGFTALDGRQYLYWGSYNGGVYVTEVTRDGLSPIGDPVQVTAWDRYEGAYVVEHDGWYYLMGSSANCCAGPATGYSVFAGRSRSPMGPFVDADGIDLNASATGGTIVVTQNGNRWIGAGHNAMFTDAAGADFLVYHAIDRDDPWLSSPFGINKRPMLIDRLDWIDGWPVVNAGAGPSSRSMPAPTTTSLLAGDPAAPVDAFTRLRAVSDPQGGQSAQVTGVADSTVNAPAGAARLRLDVKTDGEFTARLGKGRDQVKVTLDGGALTLQAGGKEVSGPVPDYPGWQTLAVEVKGTGVVAYVSEEDLADPSVRLELDAPRLSLPSAPVRLNGNALIDNVYLAVPAIDAGERVSDPQPGVEVFRDDFTSALSAQWQWVRGDAGARVEGGELVWPVRSTDLVGPGGSGGLLLTEPPQGDWIAETRLTLDLGLDSVRNYQQAGMVVYQDDDDFARLGSVAIWGTRTVEYGRELQAAPDGRLIYAGAIIGTPSPTMWMRISHTTNAEGEHLYRAGISRDGESWVWGATWTIPASSDARIGLYTGGGQNPPVDARFDYFSISEAGG